MEVDHGGGDIRVAEEGLHGSYVDTAFEEVGCEGVPEGVTGDTFRYGGLPHGVLELASHGVLVQVIAGELPGSGVCAEGCGGKYPLPGPFAGRVGVFSGKGFGDMDIARTGG